jgi:hypothetical protein
MRPRFASAVVLEPIWQTRPPACAGGVGYLPAKQASQSEELVVAKKEAVNELERAGSRGQAKF